MTGRKTPMRKCNGCGELKPKNELVRVVKSPQGEVSVDYTGRKPGRGAYICPCEQCLLKAKKAKRLERVFEMPIPDEVYALLLSGLGKDVPDGQQ